MDEAALLDIERRHEGGEECSDCYGMCHGLVPGLAAEIRRLRADNEAMKAAFSDACLDKEGLRLAKEEGRAEALLKWAAEVPGPVGYLNPQRYAWKRCFGDRIDTVPGYLPASVFDLLEGGELDEGGACEERSYPTLGAARADLAAACRKRAREPLMEAVSGEAG